MIKSFRHKGQRFYTADSKVGIVPEHAKKLRLQLNMLALAAGPGDMVSPGWFCTLFVGVSNITGPFESTETGD
jgi:plasmid maintenance system killer protein